MTSALLIIVGVIVAVVGTVLLVLSVASGATYPRQPHHIAVRIVSLLITGVLGLAGIGAWMGAVILWRLA